MPSELVRRRYTNNKVDGHRPPPNLWRVRRRLASGQGSRDWGSGRYFSATRS